MPRNASDSRLGVALTKCYFCQKDDQIVMNTCLTEANAAKIDEMHGRVIDMNPCPKCKEFMNRGIIVITVDEEKSGKDWDKQPIPNPYRTGGWFVVADDIVHQIANPKLAALILEHRFMFIAHQAAEAMGFFEAARKHGGRSNGDPVD